MSEEIRIDQMSVEEVADLLEVSSEDARAIREYVRVVGDLPTAIAALSAVTQPRKAA